MPHSLFRTITALLAVSFLFELSARPSTPPEGRVVVLKRTPTNDKFKHKRMPSKDDIYCWYDNNELYLEFSIALGLCEIELKESNSNLTISETFDSEMPVAIYIGEVQCLSITVTSENGNVYFGEL